MEQTDGTARKDRQGSGLAWIWTNIYKAEEYLREFKVLVYDTFQISC